MAGFVVSHRLYTGALTVPICRSPFSRGFLALYSRLEKPPLNGTSLFKITGCNYRSGNQLREQSRKLVTFIKVSLLQD